MLSENTLTVMGRSFSCVQNSPSFSTDILSDIKMVYLQFVFSRGRRGGIMVSAQDSGSSDPGSSLGLGKTFYSHSASLSILVFK